MSKFGGKSILVADDDSDFLGAMMRCVARGLGGTGIGVLPAADGSTALHRIQTQHEEIVAVLTDLQMPGADGYQVAGAANEHSIPVAIVTRDRPETVTPGDYDVIHKRVSTITAEIHAWLREALGLEGSE